MKPENKVVSLETAKLLKEKGFPQDTERWWSTGTYPEHSSDGGKFHASLCYRNEHFKYQKSLADRFAAPDAQELLARIHRPLRIELSSDCKIRVLIRESEGIPEGEWFESDGDENLVDVLARCWLWLKENKLI